MGQNHSLGIYNILIVLDLMEYSPLVNFLELLYVFVETVVYIVTKINL